MVYHSSNVRWRWQAAGGPGLGQNAQWRKGRLDDRECTRHLWWRRRQIRRLCSMEQSAITLNDGRWLSDMHKKTVVFRRTSSGRYESEKNPRARKGLVQPSGGKVPLPTTSGYRTNLPTTRPADSLSLVRQTDLPNRRALEVEALKPETSHLPRLHPLRRHHEARRIRPECLELVSPHSQSPQPVPR